MAEAGASTVKLAAAAGPTAIAPLVAFSGPSETETVCEPAVFSVTVNACVPASPAPNAYPAGSAACASLLRNTAVPV